MKYNSKKPEEKTKKNIYKKDNIKSPYKLPSLDDVTIESEKKKDKKKK